MATLTLRSLTLTREDAALILAALEAYEPTTSGSDSADLAQLLDRVVEVQDKFPAPDHVHESDNRSDCLDCRVLADERWPSDGHDHLEAINLNAGPLPVCARCGLVLESAGDALIVPPESVHEFAGGATPHTAHLCRVCGTDHSIDPTRYPSEDEYQAALTAARRAAYRR
jgi:hypothetical protein